ncbi:MULTISPECIES: flagellar hook assembly protein FlgD [Petrotoga]|uniref:Basal-body rod modification protein FlgD n=2 Tax=Petrotoga sibirica TaxID=156202 RepID=A0A4V3GQS6_9BACT|nr:MULTISPECIES: flagellar hook assembly protein FlgD [Petrotoga]POZ89456.1 flagellar hook capping protein FlgD [Petrotoga sibirica DSM 13575]POZ91898.1 flagellar hook capping protein FlgD [Petrotoga sp. SL27]TDX16263.1 flagellar basal-body rod modification protein FlgD [Petrotoga sibirica]
MFNSVSMDSIYQSTYEAKKGREIKKELDKEAFLQLLVAELQNQDPTQPMENKDLVAQLSQLSTTEQITNMSQAIQEMVNFQMSLNKLQAASLIGKTVVVNDNTIDLQSGVAEGLNYGLNNSSQVYLEIYDSKGQVIYTEDLGVQEAGLHSYVWSGRNNDGTMMPDGEYLYGIYTVENGQLVANTGVKSGTVEAVKFLDNELYLLINGEMYPYSVVNEISA